ncbi:MAG: PRC-barrel domain-containing protein [Brucellaceae bacterium]|jgi:hypothetical protein|nr:PRC-barrel domain-containing protein [Brucellaceae bacterium]
MLKATLLATSCALFIGSAAYAQTSDTTTAPSAPMEQQPQTSVKTENMFGNQSSDTATETNKVGFLEAKPGQLLVSSFIGQSVYESDANDAKSVGKLNDLITSPDGQIDAAVIGVGGFLGVGEKDVAVSPDQLQLAMRSDGKKWLVIKAIKEELSAAPSFDRSSLFSEGVADPAAAAKEANPEMPASTPPAAPQTNTTP